MSEVVIMPFNEAQLLFFKICNSMRRANLIVKDDMGKESAIIYYPFEKLNNQFGTIQYGGIKYGNGLTRDIATNSIKYVELRFNKTALNHIGLNDDLNIDSKYGFRVEDTDCIRFRIYYKHIELTDRKEYSYKFIEKISKVIYENLERKYGLDFYMLGLDQGLKEMPRVI